MIFETYIVEYFKIGIVDSHVRLWYTYYFLPAKESVVYKHFLSIAQSRNMKYQKQTHNCNIAKQEGKKYKREKFLLNLEHVGFY